MREFKCDKSFINAPVLKTPFRGDVARVYIRRDKKVVVQVGGCFRPLEIEDNEPVTGVLERVSFMLDGWDDEQN
jgi:hypothetical protein